LKNEINSFNLNNIIVIKEIGRLYYLVFLYHVKIAVTKMKVTKASVVEVAGIPNLVDFKNYI